MSQEILVSMYYSRSSLVIGQYENDSFLVLNCRELYRAHSTIVEPFSMYCSGSSLTIGLYTGNMATVRKLQFCRLPPSLPQWRCGEQRKRFYNREYAPFSPSSALSFSAQFQVLSWHIYYICFFFFSFFLFPVQKSYGYDRTVDFNWLGPRGVERHGWDLPATRGDFEVSKW